MPSRPKLEAIASIDPRLARCRPRLKRELEKVLREGKKAFDAGYREAVRSQRNLPHDPKVVDAFNGQRYKGIKSFHPLLFHNGYEARLGHYNNSARRTDWNALAHDLVNMHFGYEKKDYTWQKMFGLIKWVTEHDKIKQTKVNYREKTGVFQWPDILEYPSGITQKIVDLIAKENDEMNVTAIKKGKQIHLTFTASKAPHLTPQHRKTISLINDIIRYFNGEMTWRHGKGIQVHIVLPHKIPIEDYYGGRNHKYGL